MGTKYRAAAEERRAKYHYWMVLFLGPKVWFVGKTTTKNGRKHQEVSKLHDYYRCPKVPKGRGGARAGAGRKAADGAKELVGLPVRVTKKQRDWVAEQGGGAYIRRLIEADMSAKRSVG